MQSIHHRASYFPFVPKKGMTFLRLFSFILFSGFLFFASATMRAGTLADHLKQFTSVLSNRNLDSLRTLIDPGRIFVEIAPKSGSYLSTSQTLAVVESFFQSHPPVSFSYILVKEEGKTGVAIGTLFVVDGGRKISFKVNFGFQKDSKEHWLLIRITIH
jgi:hypothetical protein